MTQMCLVRHDPPNSYGDCVRACIATLLGMESGDVPHFARDNPDGDTLFLRIREWLAPRGLVPMVSGFPTSETPDGIWQHMATLNPGVPYMLITANHAVVCRDDKIEHDPAWVRSPLAAPSDVWLIVVMVNS